MTEHPILFSGPMVRAILEGRKTQTRRIVTVHWHKGRRCAPYEPYYVDEDGRLLVMDEAGQYHDFAEWCGSPYGGVGHRLWVRETWADADGFYGEGGNDCPSVVAYRADQSAIQFNARKPRRIPEYDIASWNWDCVKWRPSIFMPRWASRLELDVTAIRVERLHAMTTEDAFADGGFEQYEGCKSHDEMAGWDPVDKFHELWDSINGKRAAWETNPWVRVVSFARRPSVSPATSQTDTAEVA